MVSLWSPPIGEFGSEAVLLEMAGLSFAKCAKGIQSFQEAGWLFDLPGGSGAAKPTFNSLW